MKKYFSLMLFLCGLCLLVGCAGGYSAAPPPPAVATHFSITAPATVTAGTSFQVTVTALDALNNVVASYSGTALLSSSDTQAVLPSNIGLMNGTGTFSVTFKTATGQAITATAASITGTSNAISVSAGATTHLSVSAPSAATAAVAFNFTVAALDVYNNIATSYSGMVHFSISDPLAAPLPNSALANGTGSFSATLNTIGSATITASDSATTAITSGPSTINVVSNAVTHLLVATPGNTTTRAPLSVEVKALDAANNISVGYSGTVHFSSTDSKAILPADATLPNGIGNLFVTLEAAGAQTVTVTDSARPSVTGTSAISVTPAQTLTISSGAPPSGTVGVNYGPSTTEYLLCVFSHYRGPHWQCNPCSPLSACGSHPPCNGNIFRSPCIETRQTFTGFTFTSTGGVPPYRWNASPMPPGLNVNPNNGEILGTPTLADTYHIAVTVADSGTPPVTTTANLTLVINPPHPPVISTTPAPSAGAVNLPYSFSFTAASPAPPLMWRESGGTLPPGLSLNQDGVLSGTPTTTGSFSIMLIAQDLFKQDSVQQNFTIQVFPHGFAPTGSMTTPRYGHTATLLNNGRVLVAGGRFDGTLILSLAELFDPITGTFTPTSNMGTQRISHTATLLSDGKVLMVGGHSATASAIATAEIYDFTTGSFLPAGSLQTARSMQAAILLKTGKVLVVGGADVNGSALATAEIFDPATRAFSLTGAMAIPRLAPTATLLKDGRVLVTGGGGVTAELFDPSSGTFAPTGSMITARSGETATLLSNGKVLVAGGLDQNGHPVATAELFDPVAGTFAPTGSMGTERTQQTATLLKEGTVLMTGGIGASGNNLASAEIFDPNTDSFTPTGSMETPRVFQTSTLLPNGKVLVTGGTSAATLATAEVYQ
jgi:hypothetical protein